MKFIWESNYRPIIRAVETEAKPRSYSSGADLSRVVSAVCEKMTPTSRVFRIEGDTGVFIGVGMFEFATASVTYLRLRQADVKRETDIRSQIKQSVIAYAPLHHN